MTTKHLDFTSEFPEYKESIHNLKIQDQHFKNIFDKYEEVNKAIIRAEERIDLMSDQDEEKLRKERLALKDQLITILSSAK